MKIAEIWQRFTTTPAMRALDACARLECELREEIARLRAENRALLNSILGIAGVPPIFVERESFAAAQNAAPPVGRSSAATQKKAGLAPPATPVSLPAATPMRRRSWHQINRLLEFDSAKRKSPEIIF